MKLKLLFALLIISLAAQSQLKYAIDTPWRRQVGWLDAKKGFTPPRGIAFPASLNNLNLPTKGSMFIDTVLHRIGIWNGSSFTIIGEGGGGIGTETDPVWTSEKGSYLTSAIAAATYATAASVASKLNASDTVAMLDPYKHWTFGYLTEAAADLRYTSQSTFNARNIFNLPGIDTAGLEGDYLLLYDSASQTFKAVAFPSRFDLSRADSGLQVYNADAVVNHNGLLLWKARADALYLSLTGSYANPAWITSLAWSKVSGAPSFLTSVNIANINATGTPSATTYLRGDGTWATPAGGGGSGNNFDNELAYRMGNWQYYNEWMAVPTATSSGGNDLVVNATGTGTGAGMVATPSANRPGIVTLQTGSTATGRTSFYTNSGLNTIELGGGAATLASDIFVPNLSASGERFAFLFGFYDATTMNQTDGIYFLYDEGGVSTGSAASANWQCVTVSNSNRTFTTTSTAVSSADFKRLAIEVNAAGTSVDFKIDGTTVATHTTNIPTGNARLVSYGYQLIKSIGTSARTVRTDWIYAKINFTTSR